MLITDALNELIEVKRIRQLVLRITIQVFSVFLSATKVAEFFLGGEGVNFDVTELEAKVK